MIARRIHELMRNGVVIDKASGRYRRIQYRDIVILTRSIRGWAEDFSMVLAEEGIPAYSVSREGYFETYEVSVLLDYLKILDNARQDLPLAAVLASPFCNLTTQEMADIRIAYPNLPFYEAAAAYAGGCEAEKESAGDHVAEQGTAEIVGRQVPGKDRCPAGKAVEVLCTDSIFPKEGGLYAHS